jgi:ABC-type multidrug transport system permease subunit
MRSTVVIAVHDLRQTMSDRGAVLWMSILPLVFATFFGIVMGGGSSSPAEASAGLTVVDHDDTPLSRLLIADLEGEGVHVTQLSPEERKSSENVVRTLVIPEGFAAGALSGAQQTLKLERDPDTSQEAALVVQARIVAATSRLIGRLVQASEGLENDATLQPEAVAAVEIHSDLVAVESTFAGRATVIPGGFAQSLPGMAVMFVMLVALTYGAASISAERTSGNLRRLVTAPVSHAEIVFGKIIGRFLIAAVQITIFIIFGVVANRAFGVFIGDHPFQAWIALLLFAGVAAPLGVALGALIADPDRAASIGVVMTMSLAALGGCWWPIEIVSKPLKTLALMLPTGRAMATLHGLISFGQNLGELRIHLIVLLGFAIVFTVIATRSLRID